MQTPKKLNVFMSSPLFFWLQFSTRFVFILRLSSLTQGIYSSTGYSNVSPAAQSVGRKLLRLGTMQSVQWPSMKPFPLLCMNQQQTFEPRVLSVLQSFCQPLKHTHTRALIRIFQRFRNPFYTSYLYSDVPGDVQPVALHLHGGLSLQRVDSFVDVVHAHVRLRISRKLP